jgi:hypothetical protein
MLHAFVNCAIVLTKHLNFFFFNSQRRNEDHCSLVNCRGVEFLKLRKVHLKNEKKRFIQVSNEFSPLISKLVAYLSIKKQGVALILLRALRGWGQVDFSKNLRASLFNDYLSNEPNFSRIHLAGQ